MKVIIIEDDAIAAEQLAKIVGGVSYAIELIIVLTSIKEAIDYFKSNQPEGPVFCNITIGRDSSFTIFNHIKITAPFIYYAADSIHAIDAYQYNAIGFLLNPLTNKTITEAIENYKTLQKGFAVVDTNEVPALPDPSKKANRDSSLIITWKDKIIPVKIKDIALFNIEYKMTQAVTFNNRKYFITNTLEDLEEICGENFYRANRQFLINKEVVAEAAQHFARKLVLKLKIEGEYEIIISKNRVPEFLSWLKE